jgi:hypothetical protein
MKTYNQLVAFFNSIANAHYFVKSFGNGWDTEADLLKNNTYPYLHITPLSNSVEENTTTYRIGLIVCDLVKEDESKKHLVALVEKTLVELTENRTLVIEVRKEIADVQKAIQELKEQLNGSGSGSSTMLRGIGNVATKKK